MSIATQIAALQQDKTDIATAITNKGGTVNSGDGFDDFAADIATIPSGGGDTVTATNNTGSAISNGDKVWINKSGNDYELISFYEKKVLNYMYKYGEPTISSDFIARDFSSSKYLSGLQTHSPSITGFNDEHCTGYCKFTTGNVSSSSNQLIIEGTGFPSLRIRSGYLCCYNGSSVENVFAVTPNTTYWVKIEIDGTQAKYYSSTDGVSYTFQKETTQAISSDVGYVQMLALGYASWTNTPFDGCIDLKSVRVEDSNGNTVWTLLTTTEKAYDNYVTVAEPVVNYITGVVNNFSTSNYLALQNMIPYYTGGIQSVEIVFKAHTPTSENWTTNGRLINATSNFDDFALDVNTGGANFNFINSDINNNKTLQVAPALNSNTDYWFKITYDGTNLKGFYSTDGVNYTQQSSIARSSSELSIGTSFSVGQRSKDNYSGCVWNGSIDLSETYIKVNGEYWWRTYTQAIGLSENTMTGTASESVAVSGTGDVYIGNVIEPIISSLSITPSTSAQTFNSSSVDGYKPVSVSAVTSAIDSNITAGNIKSGVSILGVTGNYTGTTPTLITKTITQNGTYNASYDDADGYSSVTVSVSGGSSNEVGYIFTNYHSQTLNGASLVLLEGNVNSYNSSLVVPIKVVGNINRNGGYNYNTYYWLIEKNTNYSLFYLNMSSYIKIKTVNISTDTYDKGTYIIGGGAD